MESSDGPAVSTDLPSFDITASSSQKHSYDESNGSNVEQPHKRQKFMNGGRGGFRNGHGRNSGKVKNPLQDLRRGLDFVVTSPAFSSEALQHARELLRLLFDADQNAFETYATPEQGSLPTPQSLSSTELLPIEGKQDDIEYKNPHTDVPPPFPMPDPKVFVQGIAPSLQALDRTAPANSSFPPVPTLSNSATTNLVAAPLSHTLPQAPPITDVSLYNAPFMHTSALPAYVAPTGTNSYEHLEFLGDAYLEVIATRLIHARFPLHSVGQKAGLRELLVKNETLSEYTRAYGWSDRIHVTKVDRHGPGWTKIQADVFEAYLACVVIQTEDEAGFLAAEKWLTELWAPKILLWRANGDGLHDTSKQANDAKTDLNRLLAGKESKLEYREEKPMQLIKEGNRTIFFMGVYLTGWGFLNQRLGSGEGRSKQLAGAKAAEEALRNSQDIIQLAYQRKVTHERQFKKAAAKPHRPTQAHGNVPAPGYGLPPGPPHGGRH